MIPTSARRRIVIKILIDYSTGQVTPKRRIEKKTTSQSSAKAPSYTAGAGRFSVSLLPVNNGNNLEGEINKQSKQHMTLANKGKQTNKQTNKQTTGTCGCRSRGSTTSHSLWSLLCSVSEYAERLWRCLERCGAWHTRSSSDTEYILAQLCMYSDVSLCTRLHMAP